MQLAGWIDELKRRRVFRTLIGYGLVAFAILQVIEPVMHGLDLPEWVLKVTVVGLGLGFPVALVLAWAFDVKGGRIEKAGAPSGRLLAGLLIAGVALGTPGVAWFFWRSHRPVLTEKAPSIAVLPFADLSPAKDQDWMCDGIAEEILDDLYTVTGLRVAARSSSFQFKGKTIDVKDMARALGVSTLLEGSVRKVGDRLRVSARLVSSDGYELWSDKFDGGVSDAFAIQDGIARAVVSALRLRVAPESRPVGTTNPEAYELYLRGRQQVRAYGGDTVGVARELFRRAVALDDKFAEAHAGLADADVLLLQWLLAPKEEQPLLRNEALAESEHALRLSPNLAEAHAARAAVLALLGRTAEAEDSYRRATSLAPGLHDAWHNYGRFLFAQARFDEAARALEEAVRRDPADYTSLIIERMIFNRTHDEAKGVDAARRALEAADRALAVDPGDVRALYMSGAALVSLGDRKTALDRIDRAVAIKPHDFTVLYNAACTYALVGETARALDLLDAAVSTGRGYRSWLEQDPDLDPLRKLPRFQQILARLPR